MKTQYRIPADQTDLYTFCLLLEDVFNGKLYVNMQCWGMPILIDVDNDCIKQFEDMCKEYNFKIVLN